MSSPKLGKYANPVPAKQRLPPFFPLSLGEGNQPQCSPALGRGVEMRTPAPWSGAWLGKIPPSNRSYLLARQGGQDAGAALRGGVWKRPPASGLLPVCYTQAPLRSRRPSQEAWLGAFPEAAPRPPPSSHPGTSPSPRPPPLNSCAHSPEAMLLEPWGCGEAARARGLHCLRSPGGSGELGKRAGAQPTAKLLQGPLSWR